MDLICQGRRSVDFALARRCGMRFVAVTPRAVISHRLANQGKIPLELIEVQTGNAQGRRAFF
jgi:Mannose-6-phosphate isomerase C-terminal